MSKYGPNNLQDHGLNPLVLGLGVGGIKRDTKPNQAATCCHTIKIPKTPNILTDSESPIKYLLLGLIRGLPHPPDPPIEGGGEATYLLQMAPIGSKWHQITPKSLQMAINSSI